MTKTNVGGLPSGSYIVTDNSAVIAQLNERIAELERRLNISEWLLDNLRYVKAEMEAERYLKDKRIAELEKERDAVKTPAALWRVNGEPDPHPDMVDCERAALTLGNLTDDQLANQVFMHGDERPAFESVMDGTAKMPVVYLTAAKERIRWLSRQLDKALKEQGE